MNARLPLLTLVVLWLGAARALAASPQAEADALIKKGIELRKSGDDQSALHLFVKAYKLAPTPRAAVQLGLVEQALGRWTDAEEHLGEGLRSPRDPWIAKNRRAIDESLLTVKGQIGSVEVTGEPAGAEVVINGRNVGALPLDKPVRVNAGSVDVELHAYGYPRGFRTVTVVGGQHQAVVIRLEKPAPAPQVVPPVEARPPLPERPEPAPAATPWQRWVAYGAFGGAAVAAGVGGYAVLRHNERVDTFAKGCLEGPNGGLDKDTKQPDPTCESLRGEYDSARTLSVVGFVAAGALAATGVVFLLTAPDSSRGPRDTAWVCAPDLLRPGAACRFTF
jgi:hypothetical protein